MPSLDIYLSIKYPEDMEAEAYSFIRLLEEELGAPLDPRVTVDLKCVIGEPVE